MGIAVLSGVIASLEPNIQSIALPKWESHTPGTMTPTNTHDDSTPSRFIACVARQDSARKLQITFSSLGGRGRDVEVTYGQNLDAVSQSDVVLLW
jgi:pyrroline-5-carboxylate reductase